MEREVLFVGISMLPLLHTKDLLGIEKPENWKPRLGEMVMFVKPQSDPPHYVVHRVVARYEGYIITKGDNSVHWDVWHRPESLLGRVVWWKPGGEGKPVNARRFRLRFLLVALLSNIEALAWKCTWRFVQGRPQVKTYIQKLILAPKYLVLRTLR